MRPVTSFVPFFGTPRGPDVLPNESTTGPVHRPVLLDEVLHWMAPLEGKTLVDGTAGAGGHARALAERLGPTGRLIGLDRDPNMLALADRAVQGLPVTLVHASYQDLGSVLDRLGIASVDGVLIDLGLSSDQLAWSDRGFSFTRDGPLDMRFDPDAETTAADLVNRMSAEDLANLIYELGEERHSRRIARNIVEARKAAPIRSTARLAEIVRRSIPGKWGPIDPATRTFQALRIAVNDELGQLDQALRIVPDRLSVGGRFAAISFHSLEDRRVKHAFRDDPRLTVLTRKPITASDDETRDNPRARSAKLRVAERCPNPIPAPETEPRGSGARKPRPRKPG